VFRTVLVTKQTVKATRNALVANKSFGRKGKKGHWKRVASKATRRAGKALVSE
jgi:hypothetical protein